MCSANPKLRNFKFQIYLIRNLFTKLTKVKHKGYIRTDENKDEAIKNDSFLF